MADDKDEKTLQTLIEELHTKNEVLHASVLERDEQIRTLGEVDTDLAKKIAESDRAVLALKEELDAQKTAREELELKMGRPGFATGEPPASPGEQFCKSEQYENLLRTKSAGCEWASVEGITNGWRHKSLLTSDAASAGALIAPQRLPGIVAPPERVERVRALFGSGTTGSPQIEYPEETGFSTVWSKTAQSADATDTAMVLDSVVGFYPGQTIRVNGHADPYVIAVGGVNPGTNTITFAPGLTADVDEDVSVTSLTAPPTAEDGSYKPQGFIKYVLRRASASTIAAWIPATRAIINDAGSLRAQIDSRLLYGLGLSEDEQLLYGSGTDPELQGLITHPDIQSYQWSAGAPGDHKVDALRRAICMARVSEYQVSGIVLHPNDLCDMELAKSDDGMYLMFAPGGVMGTTVWRIAYVETTAIRPGQALVGAFQQGATVYDHEAGTIRIAEQHQDWFVRNMVAVLAEERILFPIFRPEGFVLTTFDEAPASP